MQVSTESRALADALAFKLIRDESKLYTKIEHLMKLKGKLGEKMMNFGANEANIKKYLVQSEMLDKEIIPLADTHQKVTDQLKARFGIVITHG